MLVILLIIQERCLSQIIIEESKLNPGVSFLIDRCSHNVICSQTTVVKKKMYYNMRVKTLQRNKADLLFRLETEKAVLQADPKNRIHKLFSAVKDVCTCINTNFMLYMLDK